MTPALTVESPATSPPGPWTAPTPHPLRAEVVFDELEAFFADDVAKARTGAQPDLARLRRLIERGITALDESDALLGLACAMPARPVDPVTLHRVRAVVFVLAMGRRAGLDGVRLADVGVVAARVDAGPRLSESCGDDVVTLRATAEGYARLLAPAAGGRGSTAYTALHETLRGAHGAQDEAALRALKAALGCYPPGTLVRLNSGEVGRVVAVNRQQPQRPGLDIVRNAYGERLDVARRVDLTACPFLHIVGLVEPRALEGARGSA